MALCHRQTTQKFPTLQDNDDHLPVALVMAQTTLYANVLVAARTYVSSTTMMDDFSNGVHTDTVNCRIHRGTSGDELRKTTTCHDSSSMGVDEVIGHSSLISCYAQCVDASLATSACFASDVHEPGGEEPTRHNRAWKKVGLGTQLWGDGDCH